MPTVVIKPVIDTILRAVDNLPPFPRIVARVIPMLRRMAPVKEIESVIRYDEAITARILAISRSPFYARRYKIRSLRDAIVVLGQRQLVEIILTACAAHYFRGQTEAYDLHEGELWTHSVAVAITAQFLAERLQRRRHLTLYTAGLLHDIGKRVLDREVRGYYDTIFMVAKQKGLGFIEAETQVLGINHEDVGALIAHRWHFPTEVEAAIRHHHHPFRAKKHEDTAAIVYTANRVAHSMGLGSGAADWLQPDHDAIFERLKLTPKIVDEVMVSTVEALREAQSILNL